ncbi:hypothetical protein UT300003_32790 [Clostridium sardiniense]
MLHLIGFFFGLLVITGFIALIVVIIAFMKYVFKEYLIGNKEDE